MRPRTVAWVLLSLRWMPGGPRSLCQRFGLDADGRARRVALVQLRDGDHRLAAELRERVLRPYGLPIVRRHHTVMMRDPTFARIVEEHSSLPRLERLQVGYLTTLGQDFESEAYFEGRLRVGITHARLHIPIGLYVCAFRALSQAIIDFISHDDRREALVFFVHKIIALDMSIALDTYHRTEMSDLERSLQSARAAERHQRRLAHRDSLTGLFNRRSIDEHLAKALQDARIAGRPLSVIMADLDHFKRINDVHGHGAGDEVLRCAADRMAAALRDSDWVGRYGGEEFLVVLRDAPRDIAVEIAERIRLNVASQPVRVGPLTVPVTISQGVATLQPDEGAAGVIRRADEALYAAKEQGRDRVVAVRLRSVPQAS